MAVELLPTEERIYRKVVKNACLMMKDRGFTEFYAAENAECLQYYVFGRERKSRNENVVALLFINKDTSAITSDVHKEELKEAFSDRIISYAVYVHKKKTLSSPQRNSILQQVQELVQAVPNFQFENYQFFYISIPRHHLQPKFVRLTEEEACKVTRLTRQDIANVSKMIWTDPIRRYYNYPVGAVIKIIEEGQSTIQTNRYRIVIRQ